MHIQQPFGLCASARVGVDLTTNLGERLDGVIRVVTLFTLLGTIVAYRRHQRRPESDPFVVITRWTVAGLAIGVLIELMAEIS